MAKSNCMLVFNIAVIQPLLWPLGQYAYAAHELNPWASTFLFLWRFLAFESKNAGASVLAN